MSIIKKSTQFLTFVLAGETYGVDIICVREVLEYTAPTQIPNLPSDMLGVIRLRGEVVPVTDMRAKLGMYPSERTVDTCILIIEFNAGDKMVAMGALADSVKEVITLEPGMVNPPPKRSSSSGSEYIFGMGRHDGDFVILLDAERLFASQDIMSMFEGDGGGTDLVL